MFDKRVYGSANCYEAAEGRVTALIREDEAPVEYIFITKSSRIKIEGCPLAVNRGEKHA